MEQAFAQEYRPTFVQRVWRRLGFGFAHLPYPREADEEHGHVSSDIIAVLDWRDRLRTLVSGRVNVRLSLLTTAPVTVLKSESAVKVLPPTAAPAAR